MIKLANRLITILLVCLLQQLHVNAYVVKNTGTVPLLIGITKEGKAVANNWYNITSYQLQPGEKGEWDANEIRNKYGIDRVMFWAYPILNNHPAWNTSQPIVTGTMPIGGNLKIIATKFGTSYIGGAVDLSTGTFYDKDNYEFALKYINPGKK